jgi:hypothetical protein
LLVDLVSSFEVPQAANVADEIKPTKQSRIAFADMRAGSQDACRQVWHTGQLTSPDSSHRSRKTAAAKYVSHRSSTVSE